MNPLVSILIPLYNAEKYIAETLQSALDQTWLHKEIIVVDDGSTDNSLAIAKQFESDQVKVYASQNSGAAATRNKAFAFSKGKFIQYLDADDLLDPRKIEAQLAYARFSEEVIIAGHWRRFAYTVDNVIGGLGPHESIRLDLNPIDWLIQMHTMQTCAWLTPRKLVENTSGWNELLKQNPNDDGEFFMRVVASSKKVLFCDEARIYYRTEGMGSLASLRTPQACRSLFETCKTFQKVLLRLENSSRTRSAVANYYQHFVYQIYPNHQDLVRQAEGAIKEYGGSSVRPSGSPLFHSLSRIIGWKIAKQIWHLNAKYLV